MSTDFSIPSQVRELINLPQYSLSQKEKEVVLLPILKRELAEMAAKIPAYQRFLQRLGWDIEGCSCLAELPYLPVSVFKKFDLCAVTSNQVARVLHSSGTGGAVSRIFLDRETAFRQQRTLAAILQYFLGKKRRPYLVLDTREAVEGTGPISARGAAILGLAPYSSETSYAMHGSPENCKIDLGSVQQFFEKNEGKEVLLFGFSYIVWLRFIRPLQEAGITFHHPQLTLLHSGGWKKLTNQAVTNEVFDKTCESLLGSEKGAVRDMYGMVEQVGSVFIDCPAGNKHSANFAEIIIRDPRSFQPVRSRETGFIQLLSALPTSYPGQSILTEDLGVLLGEDDCPCGTTGRYFRFVGRMQRAEIRGCGDTYAVAKLRR